MERVSLHSFCRDHDLPKSSVYNRCRDLGIPTSEGLTPEDCDRLRQEFNVPAPAPAASPAQAVEVESGNHSIVLRPPSLPQTYSLESLRQSEAVAFDDPLAIAAQFLESADQIKLAMAADVQARQQRLEQTKAAQDAITRKAQELTLEARLYRLQTESLDATLTKETQTLSESLQALQRLGKPSPLDAPSSPPSS